LRSTIAVDVLSDIPSDQIQTSLDMLVDIDERTRRRQAAESHRRVGAIPAALDA
jgi:hypothetical protein